MKFPREVKAVNTLVETDELLRRVAAGGAVLFLGSGFSRAATNICSEEMPTSELLALELCKINKMSPDTDLRYVADRLVTEGHASEVVKCLKRVFSVKTVAHHHVEIARVQWRRVYTTNYDLAFEAAAAQAGRAVETVGIEDAPAHAIASGDICVHLNGSMKALSERSLNSSVKLSSSSYIAPDSFVNSKWIYPFRSDLERATAIVFVGYSLYDIEVQRLLFENPELKEKTFFVTSPSLSDKERFTLQKFGALLPIGAENLAEILATELPGFAEEVTPLYTTALARYEVSPETAAVRDAEVERFLMHGDIKAGHIDSALTGPRGAPFLVVRNELERIKRFVESGRNVVVTSDFGNGKSVAATMLLSMLSLAGREAYELVDLDGDFIEDYEKIAGSSGKKCLVVDDYTRCVELLEHHISFATENVILVLFARASNHERVRRHLDSIGFSYVETSLDVVSSEEAGGFVDIIDNVGMWGDEAGLTRDRKITRITHDGRGHISEILLTIFDAPQMKARVSSLLGPVLANDPRRDTVFAICILEFLALPLTSSLISRAALNDEIYNAGLRADDGFCSIFVLERGRVRSKSSVFGLTLIRNNFSSSYVVSQLLRIVESVTDDRGEVRDVRELFKSLLRFSVVERLLPERNKKDNLVRYYEQLKRSVKWLASEPHYWVQYAMALLTFSDFSRAQGLLDQAYALAQRREGYHTDNIDTQQARLYILRCLASSENGGSSRNFMLAHNILTRVPNDVGKLRQLERYVDVYRQKFPQFSKRQKVDFEHACRAVCAELKGALNRQDFLSSRSEWLANGVCETLGDVLKEIQGVRG